MKKSLLATVIGFAGVLLFSGPAHADFILHETTTVTLKDGTIINLILSDANMPTREDAKPLKQLDLNYLQRPERMQVAQLKEKYLDHANGKNFWDSTAKITQRVYYYLPPPPHISVDNEGRPEFLFIKFVTDKAEAEGGVAGGILHFLAEYGLTSEQERELEQKLAAKIPGAKLGGAVPMESAGGDSTFQVISATLSTEDFTKKIVASGRAPLMPGLKVAVAARLTPYGATLLEETLKKPTGDISLEFSFLYTAHAPAFKGQVKYNWTKLHRDVERYNLEYQRRYKKVEVWPFYKHVTDRHSYSEVQQMYDFMCENELIEIRVEEGTVVDERVEVIRQLFLDTMTNMFFERTEITPDEEEEEQKATKSEVKPKPKGTRYRFTRYRSKTQEAFIDREFNMSWKLPVKVEYATTGKISGSWYLDSKNKYPELFDEINLDDPFFQQRKVIFNLDLDAADIFEEVINYVTIEVRKQRTTGRDFTASITIDKEYLKKKGVSAPITYAKMREDDPQAFEYMVRWSIRGGHDYPESPNWEDGNWQGVTLAPPIRPLKIEAEADLDELEQNDVVRATVQVRYYKFGKRFLDNRSIRLSVAAEEPLQSLTIYQDVDRPQWEYQVTFYHKTQGRVQSSWTRGFQDGYIYCVLPDKLRKKDSD